MRYRLTILGMALTIGISSCAGGDEAITAETSSTTATGVPTSATRPTTTTSAPATTTTTTTTEPPFMWDGDPANLTSPLDHVVSFRFHFEMLDNIEDGPSGIVTDGVFASPDGVRCVVSNPELFSPALGTLTAAGNDVWFDDDFGAPDEDLRAGSMGEDLDLCPGAAEFWDAPFWGSELFELTNSGSTESIDGMRTTLVDVVPSASLDAELPGRLWVTDQGWPVRFEAEGSIAGGFAALLDPEEDTGAEPIDVSVRLELTEVDNAALAVRSPYGGILTGPYGEVTPKLVRRATSVELFRALEDARQTDCFVQTITPFILGSADLEELSLGSVFSSGVFMGVDGTPLTNVNQRVPGMPTSTSQVMTTSAEGETRVRQVELYFRYIAPTVALSKWIEYSPDGWSKGEGEMEIVVKTVKGEEIVSWDGLALTWAEPVSMLGSDPMTVHELSYHVFLPTPPRESAMDDAVAEEAWQWIGQWTSDVMGTLDGLRTGDLQALADFRVLYEDRLTARAVACALVGHGWVASDDAFGANGSSEDVIAGFVEETAGQNAVLVTELVDVLGTHLAGTNWLGSDDIDLRTPLLGGSTDGGFIIFFSRAIVSVAAGASPEGLERSFGT